VLSHNILFGIFEKLPKVVEPLEWHVVVASPNFLEQTMPLNISEILEKRALVSDQQQQEVGIDY